MKKVRNLFKVNATLHWTFTMYKGNNVQPVQQDFPVVKDTHTKYPTFTLLYYEVTFV